MFIYSGVGLATTDIGGANISAVFFFVYSSIQEHTIVSCWLGYTCRRDGRIFFPRFGLGYCDDKTWDVRSYFSSIVVYAHNSTSSIMLVGVSYMFVGVMVVLTLKGPTRYCHHKNREVRSCLSSTAVA